MEKRQPGWHKVQGAEDATEFQDASERVHPGHSCRKFFRIFPFQFLVSQVKNSHDGGKPTIPFIDVLFTLVPGEIFTTPSP